MAELEAKFPAEFCFFFVREDVTGVHVVCPFAAFVARKIIRHFKLPEASKASDISRRKTKNHIL